MGGNGVRTPPSFDFGGGIQGNWAHSFPSSVIREMTLLGLSLIPLTLKWLWSLKISQSKTVREKVGITTLPSSPSLLPTPPPPRLPWQSGPGLTSLSQAVVREGIAVVFRYPSTISQGQSLRLLLEKASPATASIGSSFSLEPLGPIVWMQRGLMLILQRTSCKSE